MLVRLAELEQVSQYVQIKADKKYASFRVFV